MGVPKTRQEREAEIQAEHDAAVNAFTDAQRLAVLRIITATMDGLKMELAREAKGLPVPSGAAHFALQSLIAKEAVGVEYESHRLWIKAPPSLSN